MNLIKSYFSGWNLAGAIIAILALGAGWVGGEAGMSTGMKIVVFPFFVLIGAPIIGFGLKMFLKRWFK